MFATKTNSSGKFFPKDISTVNLVTKKPKVASLCVANYIPIKKLHLWGNNTATGSEILKAIKTVVYNNKNCCRAFSGEMVAKNIFS